MKSFLSAFFCMLLSYGTSAQTASGNWSASHETQKVFIENKGQFNNLNNLPGSEVLFATENYFNQILFTKNGLTYRFEERIRPDKAERQRREREMKERIKNGKAISHKEMEEAEHKATIRKDFVQMQWENANPNVVVKGVETVTPYYNYGTISYVKAYSKIVYQNIYPGIDVEYVFHPEGGIEYSFILHAGADASQIKMKYSDVENIKLDEKRSIHFPTLFGDIVEHAPQTFYSNKKTQEISSKVVLNGTTVSFALGNYDRTQEVVIDPWVQTPAFATQWDCVWECEKDAAGNAYIIGGVDNLQLLKYNPAGTLQWTYTTTYDTSNTWLGTFATDNAGNSYITEGTGTGLHKINTSGVLVYNNTNVGGAGISTELWSISFNCDQTKLVVGGTGGNIPPLPYIYNIDPVSGNSTGNVQVTGGVLLPNTQEVRCITPCGNGKYYFLTHDSIGYLNENFTVCANPSSAVKYNPHTYGLAYSVQNFRVNNTGVAAMKAYGGFIFVNRGNQLHKRDFATGALITSVTIPGGGFLTQFGRSVVENSGIDIDNCGNIYVGAKNQVVKFDQNLAQVATYPTTNSFNVYDVHVSTNGDIIACGSSGNSSSGARQGYIQSFAVSACAPAVQTCCDASICGANPVCSSATPFTLTPSTPGGVWSGTGITNSSTGQFSPALAGPGVHVIRNTLGCGSDSIRITVNNCPPVTACREQNGDITASGGSGTYAWAQQVQQQDCSACLFLCFPPGCETTVNAWQNFSTVPTITPPSYPLRVTDEYGTSLTVTTLGSLPACAACALTASASSSNATCGSSNGSATATASGATPTGYAWSNGGNTATISNVAAGTYTVTVTGGGCTATASVTVAQTGAVTTSTSSTNAGCSPTGSATVTPGGGNGSFTYLWSNGGTGASISNVAAGTYTVTVTSAGCTATASVTVSATGSVTTSVSTTNAGCTSTGSATVTPSGGNGSFTYLWSNGGTGASISNISGGTYNVTVTSGNCTATAVANIISTGGVTLTSSSTATTCANSNGSASVTATTGSAPFTYLWSTGGTSSGITNVAAGTYTVTVGDGGGCTATASIVVNASTVTPALIVTNDSLICSGDSTQICVTGTYTSYTWNTGQTTQCIYAKLAGNYYVAAIDSSNCTASSNRIPVSVYPLPPVSISVNGDTLTAYNAVTYQWYYNNTLIPNATSNIYIAPQTGDYSIAVTDSNGCRATSTKVSVIKTGIFSLGKEEVVKIYPNPLESGYWNLEVGNGLMGGDVEIFDDNGRLVYKSEITNQKSEISLYVASGIYMIRISSSAKVFTHKLIKL